MKLWQRKQEDVESQVREDLLQEERLRSKFYYKIYLTLIKYAPIICLITEILYSVLAYFCINPVLLSFIGGFSFLSILLLYIASYVFRYCKYYRWSLHSIVLVNILAIIDVLIGIPLSDLNILRVYLVTLLTGLISYIKFKVKDAKHNKKYTS